MIRKMFKHLSPKSLLVLFVLVLAIWATACGPDKVIGYQGRLTDASGNPINGNQSVTFRLWNDATSTAASAKLFEETRTVAVTNGLMNVDIGAISTDAFGRSGIDAGLFAQPLWLELVIGGQTLAPRQKLLGAPYAMSLAGGAVVGSLHSGTGSTDINYGTLTVVAANGGTSLMVGVSGPTAPGDAIRVCGSVVSAQRTCPQPLLRVLPNGNVMAHGTFQGSSLDFAEMMQPDSEGKFSPGDVIAVSSTKDKAVALSQEPYSTAVIGVYATKPGFLGGSSIDGSEADGNKIPVALVGIVPVKVSAENGAIQRGDLLTTSSTPGYAMKATEYRVGTILGKAMGELEADTGMIEVLLTLQ